jgi:hypothetical protein
MVRPTQTIGESMGSPRTGHDMLKISQLAVRPEPVEGWPVNCDTTSESNSQEGYEILAERFNIKAMQNL